MKLEIWERMRLNGQLKALEACRPYIWPGGGNNGSQTVFVCLALSRAARDGKCDTQASLQMIQEIRRVMFPHMTLASWLCAYGVPDNEMTPKAVQQHRLDWVDRMIAGHKEMLK